LHAIPSSLWPKPAPHLIRHDALYYGRWLRRARRFAGAGEVSALEVPFRRALAWLDSQPPSLLHGEFYPSNVIVERGGAKPRICPVDWEMAGLGPGLIDLAALVTGWEEPDRLAMAESYREALPAALCPAIDELLNGLDHCRLLLAVQWLGWSARWAPPPQHARDWLAAALEIGGAS
jgi:aminoglycoside phosphotransferase (APT) family kinase protein